MDAWGGPGGNLYERNKMKSKKYHNVRTVPNSYQKIVERDKITSNTHIHYCSFFCLGTDT
jgi:hypothetical protein